MSKLFFLNFFILRSYLLYYYLIMFYNKMGEKMLIMCEKISSKSFFTFFYVFTVIIIHIET
jgi:hypothetical protein